MSFVELICMTLALVFDLDSTYSVLPTDLNFGFDSKYSKYCACILAVVDV